MKWILTLLTLCMVGNAGNTGLTATGISNIPLVIVLDVVEKRLEGGNEPLLQILPNMVSARWSEKRVSDELDPQKIRMFEKRFGAPVLFGANQTATVWTQTRWVLGSGIVSYAPISGNLILSREGKEFFNKPIKDLIRDPNKKKINHGAMLIIIKVTLAELNGKVKEKEKGAGNAQKVEP